MRRAGIAAKSRRLYKVSTTDSKHCYPVAPNLLNRQFSAARPNEKWLTDITYIPTWEGWLYLATVIDCATKMVVGYAMADHYKTPLVQEALRHAAGRFELAPDAIFHSDRGSNYTSYDYAVTITELGLQQSVGRTGICYDNAMAESFFAALKNERVHRTAYPTRGHARRDVTRYIEFWYNSQRLHSGLGYRSPRETLDEWRNGQAAA